ncbi:MAG: hypothetical protein VX466_00490 [Myxococcota bacterium]|nr:hypothetical protein [Myxococcota bacterium]
MAQTSIHTTEPRDHRVRELERRIEELEAREDLAFGQFTRWDWIVCVTCAVVLPLLFTWRCAA